MRRIETVKAQGHVLCHDITRIVRGVVKDTPFRKGHVVQKEDIPLLLDVGKEHLYVWEWHENMLHENEAAEVLQTICQNTWMRASDVREGKIELFAEIDGVFHADTKRMAALNGMGELMIATRHSETPVKKGDKLAGMRVIPLVIKRDKMDAAKAAAGAVPLFEIKPYLKKRAAIVTTGSEVLNGRIQDDFSPVVQEKLAEHGTEVIGQRAVGDDPEMIRNAIWDFLDAGADLIVCTGGMSVDPDDRTPAAIKSVAKEVVSYGAPVLPGAMFMMAYAPNGVPIVGLPGCVMYSKRTIFDLVLPKLLTDVPVTRDWLARLGNGGLCLNCSVCIYPNCGFGKSL